MIVWCVKSMCPCTDLSPIMKPIGDQLEHEPVSVRRAVSMNCADGDAESASVAVTQLNTLASCVLLYVR